MVKLLDRLPLLAADCGDAAGSRYGQQTSHSTKRLEPLLPTLQLNTRVSDKSWLLNEEDSFEKPIFSAINALTQTRSINLVHELTPSVPDFQLRDACDQLVASMEDLGFLESFCLTGMFFDIIIHLQKVVIQMPIRSLELHSPPMPYLGSDSSNVHLPPSGFRCRGMKVDLLDEDDEDYSEQAETRSEWLRHRTTEPNHDERFCRMFIRIREGLRL
ncbi:hypothetical protein BJ912DRAFT_1133464 [Pholiota molesta]|nr:hypothetical protein BJ912DRAFT_1133464 [Pholiota molesta]